MTVKVKARGRKKLLTLEERTAAALAGGRAVRDALARPNMVSNTELEKALTECAKLTKAFEAINKELRTLTLRPRLYEGATMQRALWLLGIHPAMFSSSHTRVHKLYGRGKLAVNDFVPGVKEVGKLVSKCRVILQYRSTRKKVGL